MRIRSRRRRHGERRGYGQYVDGNVICALHMAYFYIQFRSTSGVRGVKREEAVRVVQIRVKASRANLERRASRCRILWSGVLFGEGWRTEDGTGG